MVLKKIGVLSAGKIMGCLYALGGLIGGIFVALLSLVGAVGGAGAQELGFMLAGGVFAIVLLPLIYGVVGFIGGIIGAAIYNLVASLIGGIEMEFSNN